MWRKQLWKILYVIKVLYVLTLLSLSSRIWSKQRDNVTEGLHDWIISYPSQIVGPLRWKPAAGMADDLSFSPGKSVIFFLLYALLDIFFRAEQSSASQFRCFLNRSGLQTESSAAKTLVKRRCREVLFTPVWNRRLSEFHDTVRPSECESIWLSGQTEWWLNHR